MIGNMATKKFKCKVCGYIHEGDSAPAKCPKCQAPASEFEEIVENNGANENSQDKKAQKKGLNTNSNTYIIVYSSILVIIVAFLLAFVSSVLKPTQDANVAIDKKQQILASLNIRNLPKDSVEIVYGEVVKLDMVFGKDATPTKTGETEGKNGQHDQAGFKVESKDLTDEVRPFYVCEVNGETKYVIPVTGAGLWGSIWGYIAINDDCATVYGSYFSHSSETAGLGARIVEEGFQNSFINKKLFDEKGENIVLSVVKKGKKGEVVYGSKTYEVPAESSVDGITGATLTSDGVNAMLHDGLSRYKDILNSYKK